MLSNWPHLKVTGEKYNFLCPQIKAFVLVLAMILPLWPYTTIAPIHIKYFKWALIASNTIRTILLCSDQIFLQLKANENTLIDELWSKI